MLASIFDQDDDQSVSKQDLKSQYPMLSLARWAIPRSIDLQRQLMPPAMTVSCKPTAMCGRRIVTSTNLMPLNIIGVSTELRGALTVIASDVTSDGGSRSPGRLQEVGINHIDYEGVTTCTMARVYSVML
jgi:hypothetical protein